jgi:regulatory protein
MIPDKSINDKSYHLALKYLKYRSRSRLEIQRYLKGKKFSDKTIIHTIQLLEADGLVDDVKFARLWVENRRRLKPKGTIALRIELRRKGINDEFIDQALKDDDEEKNALAAIASRKLRWDHLDVAERKKKAFGFLRSRGFSFEVCLDLSERFSDDKLKISL